MNNFHQIALTYRICVIYIYIYIYIYYIISVCCVIPCWWLCKPCDASTIVPFTTHNFFLERCYIIYIIIMCVRSYLINKTDVTLS